MGNRYIQKEFKPDNKIISPKDKEDLIRSIIGDKKNEEYEVLSELIDCYSIHENPNGLYPVLYFS
ncbi:MAG: hypothetical protein R2771_15905 [Saprospiraceae bacterium]